MQHQHRNDPLQGRSPVAHCSVWPQTPSYRHTQARCVVSTVDTADERASRDSSTSLPAIITPLAFQEDNRLIPAAPIHHGTPLIDVQSGSDLRFWPRLLSLVKHTEEQTLLPQVVQKLGRRIDAGDQEVIPRARARHVQQVALGVVHFLQI